MDPNDFDAAFQSMLKDDVPVDTPVDTPVDAPVDAPVDGEAEGTQPGEGEGVGAEGEGGEGEDEDGEGGEGEGSDAAPKDAPPAKPEPKNAPKDDTPALTDEQLMEMFANIVRKAPKAQPEKEPDQAQQPEPEIYSSDEKKLIDAYRSDFPDVATAEALIRRAEHRAVVGYVFDQVKQFMQPFLENVDLLTTRTHLSDLQSKVGDYDTIRDQVISWVDEQPAYLRDAYQHVINSGTVDEVTDLIDRFRKETGASAPQAQQMKPLEKQTKRELPSEAKKAAAGLAPVTTARTTPSTEPDKGDFEAAFAKFAKLTL